MIIFEITYSCLVSFICLVLSLHMLVQSAKSLLSVDRNSVHFKHFGKQENKKKY